MWHGSYCAQTSSKKFNMYRHEKRMYSTQTQPENSILEAVKNGQLNEVKFEDNPLFFF